VAADASADRRGHDWSLLPPNAFWALGGSGTTRQPLSPLPEPTRPAGSRPKSDATTQEGPPGITPNRRVLPRALNPRGARSAEAGAVIGRRG
jgi:hypothetical protein